jgi:hypothetical protein
MNHLASNPAYPRRRSPPVEKDLRRPAPWISLALVTFHAIVTAVSPERDRDFTKSVTV